MQNKSNVHGKKAGPKRVARGVRMWSDIWACLDWQAERTGENASRLVEQVMREKCAEWRRVA